MELYFCGILDPAAVQDRTEFPSLITNVLLQLVRDIINGVCDQRYENVLNNRKVVQLSPNVKCLRCRKKFGSRTIIKSIFDCRFNSNRHTHMFLFVTQPFWVFIVGICFFWCAIWVYLKSQNGSPACDC